MTIKLIAWEKNRMAMEKIFRGGENFMWLRKMQYTFFAVLIDHLVLDTKKTPPRCENQP